MTPTSAKANRAKDLFAKTIWHLLFAGALMLGLCYRSGMAAWRMTPGELLPIGLLTAGYLLCAVLFVTWTLVSKKHRGPALLAIQTLFALTAWLVIKEAGGDLIWISLVSGTVSLGLSEFVPRFCTWGNLVIPIPVIVLIYLGYRFSQVPTAAYAQEFARTAYYTVAISSYRHPLLKPTIVSTAVPGGGIERLGDGYLVTKGDGHLYYARLDDQRLRVRSLGVNVPINRDEFRSDNGDDVRTSWFRVNDILVDESDGRIALYASYNHWNRDQKCFTSRVARTNSLPHPPDFEPVQPAWEVLHETVPCLPIKRGSRYRPGVHPYEGLRSGGRLVLLTPTQLLISVGDYAFDGWDAPRNLPQDPEASYGKVLLLDLDSGEQSTYTLGHRNPSGLLIDSAGILWETEHGPRGGDELNRLERGKNYGWPQVSYGTDYSLSFSWPLSAVQGSHAGYEEPVFSWLPSIGIGSLAEIAEDRFAVWKGDLVAGTLRDAALFRIRRVDQRVVNVEKIDIGKRVRDLIEAPDGALLLWTDFGELVKVEPATGTKDGAALFSVCAGCHAVENGLAHGIGPDLSGIFGRAPGAAKNYDYSPAMKNLGGTWSKKRLSAFLADPQGYAPGTSMVIEPIADAQTRTAIVDYLDDKQ